MPNKPFLLFSCDMIKDRFVLIFKRSFLKLARAEHPDVPIYHVQEFETIFQAYHDKSASRKAFKKLHILKKKFKGWLVPADKGKLKFKWK